MLKVQILIVFVVVLSFKVTADEKENHSKMFPVELSEYSDYKNKQCKLLKGVLFQERLTNHEICKYKIGSCNTSEKKTLTKPVFCMASDNYRYECYLNNLWSTKNPMDIGFKDTEYRYSASKIEEIENTKYTKKCAYW